jgi:hypothetical protein
LLTYAQDLMNHAVLGTGYLKRWLDVALLPVLLVFLIPAAQLHHRSRVLGYRTSDLHQTHKASSSLLYTLLVH